MSLSYSFLRLAVLVVRRLPFPMGYGVADRCADVVFLLSAKHRRNISHNLQCITGMDKDNIRLKRKVRQMLRNLAKNYFDLTKLSQMNLEDLKGIANIEGLDNFTRAASRGKGVILATAHLGNFEFGAQVLVLHGIEMSILVEELDSSSMMQNIDVLRQRKGARILPVNMSGMKAVFYSLLHGGTVIIASDRDIQGNGIKTKFLGDETPLPVGAVSLAIRTGAALIPIFSVRTTGNKSTIYIEPEIKLSDNSDRQQAVKDNLEKLAAVMEEYIRKYPEQWVVLEPLGQTKAEVGSGRAVRTSDGLFN